MVRSRGEKKRVTSGGCKRDNALQGGGERVRKEKKGKNSGETVKEQMSGWLLQAGGGGGGNKLEIVSFGERGCGRGEGKGLKEGKQVSFGGLKKTMPNGEKGVRGGGGKLDQLLGQNGRASRQEKEGKTKKGEKRQKFRGSGSCGK